MGSYVKIDKKNEDEVNPPVLDFGPILEGSLYYGFFCFAVNKLNSFVSSGWM